MTKGIPMSQLDGLTEIVGPQHVLTGDAAQTYLVDWRDRYRGAALAVVRPGSPQEVAKVVKWCLANQVPLVPQGGNTGLCGGATPDGDGSGVVLVLMGRNKASSSDLQ